jgi:hypothetical protein
MGGWFMSAQDKKILSRRMQLVRPDGRTEEIGADNESLNKIAKQMEQIKSQDSHDGSRPDYIPEEKRIDGLSEEKLVGKDLSSVLDTLKRYAAIEAPLTDKSNGPKISFEDAPWWHKHVGSAFRDENDVKNGTVNINHSTLADADKILDKIASGEIEKATIKIGDHRVVVENGKIKELRDGAEDEIPKSVMKHAADYAQKSGEGIVVLPVSDREGTEYIFVDKNCNVIPIAFRRGPDGAVSPVDPKAPTYNSTPGIGVADTEPSLIKPPHIDNPRKPVDVIPPSNWDPELPKEFMPDDGNEEPKGTYPNCDPCVVDDGGVEYDGSPISGVYNLKSEGDITSHEPEDTKPKPADQKNEIEGVSGNKFQPM